MSKVKCNSISLHDIVLFMEDPFLTEESMQGYVRQVLKLNQEEKENATLTSMKA